MDLRYTIQIYCNCMLLRQECILATEPHIEQQPRCNYKPYRAPANVLRSSGLLEFQLVCLPKHLPVALYRPSRLWVCAGYGYGILISEKRFGLLLPNDICHDWLCKWLCICMPIEGGNTLLHMLSVACWGNPASANLPLTKSTSLGHHSVCQDSMCWLP